MNTHEEIKLQIPGEVQSLLEDRLIQREDLQQVIQYAETTGEKFINPSNGRCLAMLRPARVTYWVEYSVVEDGYRIYSAYSHRMEMKRGSGS